MKTTERAIDQPPKKHAKSAIKNGLKNLSKIHRSNVKKYSTYIKSLIFCEEPYKTRKDKTPVQRGRSSFSARLSCSAYIRQSYLSCVIADGGAQEHCVVSLNSIPHDEMRNHCLLCHPLMIGQFTVTSPTINLSQTLGKAMNCNMHPDSMFHMRMNCMLQEIIGFEYPSRYRRTTIVVKFDNKECIKSHVRFASNSTLLKNIGPCGSEVTYIYYQRYMISWCASVYIWTV